MFNLLLILVQKKTVVNLVRPLFWPADAYFDRGNRGFNTHKPKYNFIPAGPSYVEIVHRSPSPGPAWFLHKMVPH